MSSENPVADRLVTDARKKASRPTSTPLDIAALAVSLVGLAVSGWIPGLGMLLGLAGIIVGVVATRKPGNIKLAWTGVAFGVVAIVVSVLWVLQKTGTI